MEANTHKISNNNGFSKLILPMCAAKITIPEPKVNTKYDLVFKENEFIPITLNVPGVNVSGNLNYYPFQLTVASIRMNFRF